MKLEWKTNVITEPVRQCIEKKGLNACVQQMGSIFTLFFGKREKKNLNDARELDLEEFWPVFSLHVSEWRNTLKRHAI